MDQITFQHDTVLSDIHMLLPNAHHLMTRLNGVGQPVFISKFKIMSDGERHDRNDPGEGLKEVEEYDKKKEDGGKDTKVAQGKDGEEGGKGNVEPFLDEDGDLDIMHRPRTNPKEDSGRDVVCPVILQQSNPVLEQEEGDTDDEDDKPLNNIIKIEHTMATPLEDVGKQVWRGAFFLADFIVSKPHIFRGATVLELGAGTGLTSIIMATIAKTVYCTDVGEDLLSMCKKNVTLNRHMMEPAVCYDDDLTDGLFRTLYRLCCSFSHTCTIFISIEKRMNFTLRHMDVSCDAYNHFRHCLFQLQDLVDGRCSFRVEQLPSNFAQFLLYERIEQLLRWKVLCWRCAAAASSGAGNALQSCCPGVQVAQSAGHLLVRTGLLLWLACQRL
ncbi:methyltransferase-like protein 22 isoform X5 [Epinephelus lanceolatus]|uniref:methyltransferase-like protein 22 isoform X5 n=1 Tax=Epinephelus lanceolatus TaxID=310571 RepID=UPI00144727A0|nr:methyltransferase-like protein 22 isoform X5 [Epinephelus lanceolatus]